jgi:hypothetical protein
MFFGNKTDYLKKKNKNENIIKFKKQNKKKDGFSTGTA